MKELQSRVVARELSSQKALRLPAKFLRKRSAGDSVTIAHRMAFVTRLACGADGIALPGRMKLRRIVSPCSVRMDSGWNYTSHSGRVAWRSAIVAPSLVHASFFKSGGSGSTTVSE